MPLALVVTFDARQTLFGKLTYGQRGLVIRAWDSEEFRSKGRTKIEMRGGVVKLAPLFPPALDVTIVTEAETESTWTGWIQFTDPGQLDSLPILRALRDIRPQATRAVVQYQKGAGSLRLDLKDPLQDPTAVLAALRQRLLANSIVASTQIKEFTEPLEAWDPRPPILP